MPDLFVPEATWGPKSWGVNHPLDVRAQIEHGLDEAGYGYWGFSPASNPFGGYREYGVDAIGMDPAGLHRPTRSRPTSTPATRAAATGDQPDADVTATASSRPHASFLALPLRTARGRRQPARTSRPSFDAYGDGGFYDAVAVRCGTQARSATSSLDQGMVMAALGNVLGRRRCCTSSFGTRPMEKVLRPLIGQEEFGAGVDQVTDGTHGLGDPDRPRAPTARTAGGDPRAGAPGRAVRRAGRRAR